MRALEPDDRRQIARLGQRMAVDHHSRRIIDQPNDDGAARPGSQRLRFDGSDHPQEFIASLIPCRFKQVDIGCDARAGADDGLIVPEHVAQILECETRMELVEGRVHRPGYCQFDKMAVDPRDRVRNEFPLTPRFVRRHALEGSRIGEVTYDDERVRRCAVRSIQAATERVRHEHRRWRRGDGAGCLVSVRDARMCVLLAIQKDCRAARDFQRQTVRAEGARGAVQRVSIVEEAGHGEITARHGVVNQGSYGPHRNGRDTHHGCRKRTIECCIGCARRCRRGQLRWLGGSCQGVGRADVVGEAADGEGGGSVGAAGTVVGVAGVVGSEGGVDVTDLPG